MFKCVFKSINVGSLWYKNDCYILATQARMVFYLPDTKFGPNWQVVQIFEQRHLYNVSQSEGVQYNSTAYQEDECCEEEGMRNTVSDITYDKPLNIDDEQGPVFEAAEIARLMKDSNREVHHSDDEDEEDDTLLEYCSEEDQEGATTVEVDSDDE